MTPLPPPSLPTLGSWTKHPPTPPQHSRVKRPGVGDGVSRSPFAQVRQTPKASLQKSSYPGVQAQAHPLLSAPRVLRRTKQRCLVGVRPGSQPQPWSCPTPALHDALPPRSLGPWHNVGSTRAFLGDRTTALLLFGCFFWGRCFPDPSVWSAPLPVVMLSIPHTQRPSGVRRQGFWKAPVFASDPTQAVLHCHLLVMVPDCAAYSGL